MQHMWAPWRMEYITGTKPKNTGCIFCLEKETWHSDISEEEAKRLIVYKGKECFVMLNKYPYAAGHLMILPFRHIGDITELTPSESAEIMFLSQESAKILREECRVDGINMGVNLGSAAGAGVADHLHFHAVPRWHGDSQFIAVTADIRLIPEHLEKTQARFMLAFLKKLG